MSLMSELGTAIKNKMGGSTTTTTSIPKYKDSNSTLESSGVTIDSTNKVIAPGGFSGNLIGNANTATSLETARNIALSGDVVGSANFNGTSNITISTTIQPNSVALGTDTTGNYTAGVTAGTGITVSGTAGEGWSPTVAISNIGTAGTYTKVTTNSQGQVTSGTALAASDIPNLDASKITSGIIDAARLPAYVDDVLEFANLTSFPTTGETGKIYIALDTNKTYRWSGSAYVYITSGAVDSVNAGSGISVNTTTGIVTVSHADTSSQANINNSGRTYIQSITLDTYGHITGVTSATETAVSNVTTNITTTHNATNVVVNSSDGTNGTINAATTTLAGVMSNTDKIKLDGITTGATANTGTVTSVTGTGTVSGLSLSGTVTSTGNITLAGTLSVTPSNFASQAAATVLAAPSGTAGVPTFRPIESSDIPILNQNTTGNAATATKLQTARTIGGVSFDGTANINLPGVNTSGNQNTTGSAATLTTGRTIGMTGDVTWTSASFNGSANVTGTATLANSGVTAGTYKSVTVDAKGRVTAGTNPTTLSGYGITDAYTKTEVVNEINKIEEW